jgi:hypothetical protein
MTRVIVVYPHEVVGLGRKFLARARLDVRRLLTRPEHDVPRRALEPAAVLMPFEIRRGRIGCLCVRRPHAHPLASTTRREIWPDLGFDHFGLEAARDESPEDAVFTQLRPFTMFRIVDAETPNLRANFAYEARG